MTFKTSTPPLPKPLTPAQQRMADVINRLLEDGWTEDGRTAEQTFRMPTTEAPIYGGVGGKLVTTGGRLRFAKGDSKVTVGKLTTYFWRLHRRDGLPSQAHVPMNMGVDWVMFESRSFGRPETQDDNPEAIPEASDG